MKKELAVTIGISGSGKSKWATNLKLNRVVSSDIIRKELTGNVNDQSKNKEVFKIANELLESYANDDNDSNVIYDATNCNIKYLFQFYMKFSKLYNITYVIFDMDIETCWNRIQSRDNGANVSKKTLLRQYKGFKEVLWTIKNSEEKTIIFDSRNKNV